ncbi:hypothetical protein BC830DRAFT_727111 [Chytriomyces sp. MP71]|nr:hypothetical protein BC830DRAFT_727111 [Chytriomyces sp. MP71]
MRLVITRRKKAWPPGSCLSNQPAHGESILPQYPTPKSQKALNPNSLSSGGMQHQEYPQTSLPSSCPHVVSAFKQAVNAANPSLKSAMTPSPSPIGSPRCNASQSRLASSPSFTSPQLPPLQYHLSQVAMQPLRPQVPLHGNIPIARYQMTCPTHQLHCQSHQYYHPSQSQHYDVAGIQNAPILKSQTAVPQVQPCQSNASAQPHPQPHHQTPVTLSDNYIPPLPNPPRKRGRKSKQDLLLNRVHQNECVYFLFRTFLCMDEYLLVERINNLLLAGRGDEVIVVEADDTVGAYVWEGLEAVVEAVAPLLRMLRGTLTRIKRLPSKGSLRASSGRRFCDIVKFGLIIWWFQMTKIRSRNGRDW